MVKIRCIIGIHQWGTVLLAYTPFRLIEQCNHCGKQRHLKDLRHGHDQ